MDQESERMLDLRHRPMRKKRAQSVQMSRGGKGCPWRTHGALIGGVARGAEESAVRETFGEAETEGLPGDSTFDLCPW